MLCPAVLPPAPPEARAGVPRVPPPPAHCPPLSEHLGQSEPCQLADQALILEGARPLSVLLSWACGFMTVTTAPGSHGESPASHSASCSPQMCEAAQGPQLRQHPNLA